MDIVYVLIGFVCGFLCDASIHYMKWKRDRNKRQSRIHMEMENMTLAEVKEMCRKVSAEIIREKKELDNENN